jgi:uncharacterized protein
MTEFFPEPAESAAPPDPTSESLADSPAAQVKAAPVTQPDRILTLDLIRGFAVLGILLVNIWAYGLPFPAALNPRMTGLESVADRIAYIFVFMVALTKTMPIFSMLFGAGIVLFAQRLEGRGLKPAGYFVRRQLWLLLFGLAHAYLLWNGDILVPYAGVGLILYRLRRRSPRALLILAIIAMLLPKIAVQFGGMFMEKMQVEAVAAEAARAAGDTLTVEQERALEMWEDQGPTWNPTEEDVAELTEIQTGDYLAMIAHHAPETAMMHLFMYPLIIGWNIAGFMLIGMMLFKSGVLTGERSAGFYARMAVICYGIGVPAALFTLWFYDTRFEFIPMMRFGFPMESISGPLVALGHIALLGLAHKRRWFAGFQPRLRAAGRMAFTNYLTQTFIFSTVFFGFGLGLFGAFGRLPLLGLVVAVWILQLWWSLWWLERFRFGPMEWVWRSLTYRSRQPFRR